MTKQQLDEFTARIAVAVINYWTEDRALFIAKVQEQLLEVECAVYDDAARIVRKILQPRGGAK